MRSFVCAFSALLAVTSAALAPLSVTEYLSKTVPCDKGLGPKHPVDDCVTPKCSGKECNYPSPCNPQVVVGKDNRPRPLPCGDKLCPVSPPPSKSHPIVKAKKKHYLNHDKGCNVASIGAQSAYAAGKTCP